MQPFNTHITIEQLKKGMFRDALDFNLNQYYARSDQLKRDRHNQINESKLLNKRVETEFVTQLQNQRNKKLYVQNMLASDYERQIKERQLLQNIERKRNKSFAKREEIHQIQYHDRRARELERILRGQRSFLTINPQDSITKGNIKHSKDIWAQKKMIPSNIEEIDKVVQFEMHKEEKKTQKKKGEERIERGSLEIGKLHSETVIDLKTNLCENKDFEVSAKKQVYFNEQECKSKDSLGQTIKQNENDLQRQSNNDNVEQQTENKKDNKQQSIRQSIIINKQMTKNNGRVFESEKEELKEMIRRQQAAYKKGLNDQIAQKKAFRNLY